MMVPRSLYPTGTLELACLWCEPTSTGMSTATRLCE
jgi:hypothetical protein